MRVTRRIVESYWSAKNRSMQLPTTARNASSRSPMDPQNSRRRMSDSPASSASSFTRRTACSGRHPARLAASTKAQIACCTFGLVETSPCEAASTSAAFSHRDSRSVASSERTDPSRTVGALFDVAPKSISRYSGFGDDSEFAGRRPDSCGRASQWSRATRSRALGSAANKEAYRAGLLMKARKAA